ncbi:hypothetical protein X907_1451 [Glycocaulis alkaliphilus]|uniref:Uncharacterized protein n=2 Tax=Glycocaulis alkaliphilus TaxID=1434191 RepID=A0A3T0E9H8_9PROT|nr:hypothetical protein [Glycocaulis alkaliphilus]AZU03984.1 hypothetical protein X907_1451 [Glycocaulis alkaliphilus]
MSPPESELDLPAVTVQDVMSAWEAGQAAEAGRLAEAYLTARTADDGRLGVEGAGLAFIAGIGRVISAGREDAHSGYWMWVARQHEDVCGALPDQYSTVIDIMMTAPGRWLRVDRLIRGGPFLDATSQPCRDEARASVIPAAANAVGAPGAVVVFSHDAERGWGVRGRRPTVRVPLIFEYPAGALSPSLAQGRVFEIRFRSVHAVPGGAIVLSPCSAMSFDLGMEVGPLCRADQPGSGEE